METDDTRNEEEKAAGEIPSDPCSMMSKCMKGCRWFPLFPIILGIVLLLLGYYLDAEVIRIIWMIVSGLVIVLGILGLFMMGKMKNMCGG